mgnify:CR=1 FL=1
MVKKYSFKEFLTEEVELINSDDTTSRVKIDRITIPMIQRDYAQGRKIHAGKDGQLILNPTGQKFINEVFSTVIRDAIDKQLELDFVYGSIITEKEEKNGIPVDVTYFNPLDGQQRLTTLFLMYWFVGGVELIDDERKNLASILKNFYYKTRTSSTVFCNKLVNELNLTNNDYLWREDAVCEDNIEIASRVDIITQIENLSWFHDAYKLDPTVQAMLNMLDEIRRQYLGHECKNIFAKLERLKFYILPLSNFGLTEDLYVKMNARGKQLTDFENFKADFQYWIKDNIASFNLEEQEYDGRRMSYDMFFINKIDNEWSQCFWNAQKDSEDKSFDSLFLSFIYKYLLNEYILGYSGTNKGLDKEPDFISLSDEVGYSGFSLFERNLSKESLENLRILLDQISAHYDEIIEISQPCWADSSTKFDVLKRKLTLQERTVFCALIMYLIKKDFDKAALKIWLHVVWNIAENANIDSWRAAAGVIQLIMELVEHSDDIYALLADDFSTIKSSQSKDTIAEERKKAKLIRSDPEWADVLLQAESHPFFKGSVSFLIPEDNSINGFIHNLKMAELLFDANGVSSKYQSNGHILLRALLSKYNALTDIKYHITDKKEKENSLKNMLASDPVVRSAFAEWLSLPTEADIYNKLFDEIAKESPIPVGENDFDKKLHQLLYKTTDLVDWMQQYGAIRYKDNYISRPSSSYDWIYVYGYSNEMITELIMRGWTCENRCTIGEGPNKKEIPYYWSAAGREIDVSKSICNNGNTVVLRCSVGSENITLMKDDTIIEILKYNACVTNKRRVKRFVNCIERRFNE